MRLRQGNPHRMTDIAVLRRFARALEIAPENLGLAPGQASGDQQRHPPVRPGAGEFGEAIR